MSFMSFYEFSTLLPYAHAPVDGCAPDDARICEESQKLIKTHKTHKPLHCVGKCSGGRSRKYQRLGRVRGTHRGA